MSLVGNQSDLIDKQFMHIAHNLLFHISVHVYGVLTKCCNHASYRRLVTDIPATTGANFGESRSISVHMLHDR